VPLMGRFDDAYTYLPNSVKRFPGPRDLAGRLAGAGLSDVRYVLTAGGIIALHVGVKPGPGAGGP
jgi:demethylmenaquinone methyltransferase / 2-methoxy-6-polyprenyl-1,4-benzoquinol methylase